MQLYCTTLSPIHSNMGKLYCVQIYASSDNTFVDFHLVDDTIH